jgi:DNA-binding beta-propeller fold protein YncE
MKLPPRIGAALVPLLIAASCFAAPAAEKPFAVRGRIAVGGEGGWDYVAMDSRSNRLFVSHGTRVVVVDTRSDSVIAEIGPTPGVHGIALAPELGRGWTSNGRDSTVTVFDYASLKTLASIKLPARNPDAIAFDAASERVFTFNGGSANTTAIDARTNAIVGTVALGGKPEFAVTDSAGHLWVNNEDSSEVVLVDTRKLVVISRWPLAPGESPSGLALDRAHHRLFAVCANEKLVVLDSDNGRIVATLPIGKGVDAVAYDPKRGLVFTSNGEGTMTVVREDGPDAFRVLETVTTERGARTLALDVPTGRLYLPSAEFGPPPEPTADRPHPRAPIVPGSFRVLVVSR